MFITLGFCGNKHLAVVIFDWSSSSYYKSNTNFVYGCWKDDT